MKLVVTGIVSVMLVLSLGLARAAAMQAPAPPEKAAAAKADPAAEPKPIDQQDRAVLQQLGQRAQGLIDARAVLQRELDAVTADFSRVAQQIAAKAPAGYVLDPQTMTYVPAPAKKDEPKKDPPQ